MSRSPPTRPCTARPLARPLCAAPVCVLFCPQRQHFLREQKKQAPSSINVAICALRFFCTHTLARDWPVFEHLRVNKPRMLPTVLSTTEVRALLASVRHPVRRMALGTI